MPIVDEIVIAQKRKTGLWIALLVFLTCVLLALNILTLLNDRLNLTGFNALKSVLSHILSDSKLAEITSGSPTKRLQRLEQAKIELETRHAALTKLSAIRADLAKHVAARVVRRVTLNAIKNASSVALEVVPFVGATVVLAVTASDLYDDCQSLKDMNELTAAFEQERHDEGDVCGMKIPYLSRNGR